MSWKFRDFFFMILKYLIRFFISAWKGGVEGRGRLNNTLLFRCWLHALV